MGYNTSFWGEAKISPPASEETICQVDLWGAKGYERLGAPDTWEANLPDGLEWECPFYLERAGEILMPPDERGKWYGYGEWLRYLVGYLAGCGHQLTGKIGWEGEDPDDVGFYTIQGGTVTEWTRREVWFPAGTPDPVELLLRAARGVLMHSHRPDQATFDAAAEAVELWDRLQKVQDECEPAA